MRERVTQPAVMVAAGLLATMRLKGLTMSSREQRDAADELAAATEQLQQLGKTELACWIDDAWRAVIPYGPEAVIAAIRELVEITVEQWPEHRGRLLQELQSQQQRLSE